MKEFHDRTNNNNDNNNNNNNSKQNECNCKTRTNCPSPMNVLCNLDNTTYQGIIYPKENFKDKKNLYRDLVHEMED